MTIIKIVDQVKKGGQPSKALADLLKMLSEAAHVDRGRVAEVEARFKDILAGEQKTGAERPLHLTGEELNAQLAQIEVYFKIEYEILLQETAELVSKCVMLAGEQGSERLVQLKSLGFAGLGRIERINVDRILWIFLAVSVGGFLILFLGSAAGQRSSAEGLARFAFAMAIAALIGAIVGSSRRHARAQSTPWSRYLLAGLTAGAIFFGIQAVTALVKSYAGIAPPPGQPPFSAYRMLPWTMLPLVLTIAIAALARVPHWPTPLRLKPHGGLWERVLDGVCVSAAILLAYYVAIAMHYLLGIDLPRSLQERMSLPHILPIPIFAPLQVFGFFIGFFVLRDVRRAAHARIVEATGEYPAAPPGHALASAHAARSAAA